MSSRVVVVGSYNQDLLWNCPQFPKPGETLLGSFASSPGGKGSNQAVAASRSGADTVFIGAVGSDVFASAARTFLESEGIDTALALYPNVPTGNAGIFVDSNGENEIIVASGANAFLLPDDLRTVCFDGAGVVVCQFETNLEANRKAFELGRATGATNVLNPAPMRSDFTAQCLENVDVLVPNETEFMALLPRLGLDSILGKRDRGMPQLSNERIHIASREMGIPNIIVTLGSRGCVISNSHGLEHIPSLPDTTVVDTTGAGDAFVGGMAAGLIRFDGNIVRAARYGNIVAGLSVSKQGAAPSMPYKAEIEKTLSRHSI